MGLVRILGALGDRKRFQVLELLSPFILQTDSECGSVPHEEWMQQSMVGQGKEDYWFFLPLLREIEDLGCLCLAPALVPICMEVFVSRDRREKLGHPQGWKLPRECSDVTVASWSKVFCWKNIDTMSCEIDVSSQCLFPEMCGMYEMHPGEVHQPNIYQGPLVRVKELSGAFCPFSNTAVGLLCRHLCGLQKVFLPGCLQDGVGNILQKHFTWEEYCSLRQLLQCVQHCWLLRLLSCGFAFPKGEHTSCEHNVHQGTKWCLERCLTPLWMYSQSFSLLSPLPFIWQKCLELKTSLMAQQKGTQSSLERLKTLIRLIQSEQMIQVTMTTTTTTSLLSIPWIKPSAASAAMHKALQPSQGNNWQELAVRALRDGRGETSAREQRRDGPGTKDRRSNLSFGTLERLAAQFVGHCGSTFPRRGSCCSFVFAKTFSAYDILFCYVGLNVFMTEDELEKRGW